ncbi:MAG: hypothetical protein OSA40_00450 [Phycisphaerales bacterium]|nr:hypothetical protein [Phycisphaerales bacterium]
MSRPRPIQHDPRPDLPVPCGECGYDLRGAVAGARCPECGGKIPARSSATAESMQIHSIHESGLSQVAASQIGSFIPLAGFLLIHTVGPILAVLTAFGPCYRLLALHIRYRTSEMRRFEPAGFGRILLILAWLESLAALAVVATLVGVIPSAAWWSMTLIYTLAATLSVATTNFLIARATAGWGSTIAPKVFRLGGVAALLAGVAAIGGRMSLMLVTNQPMAAVGFVVALVISGVLAAIAVVIVRDGIARIESVLGNDLIESHRIETTHGIIPVELPPSTDPAPLPLEPERPPVRPSDRP